MGVDFGRVLLEIFKVLKMLVMQNRGTLTILTSRKLMKYLNVYSTRRRSVMYVIRTTFEDLVEAGLMKVLYRSARGKVYGIEKGSEFYQMLVSMKSEEIVKTLCNNDLLWYCRHVKNRELGVKK